ncbi:MAG TPA: FAD-dependent oxidoreductase, partial [Candidatus Binataceae bacterium]|nr:FAD-dependent oxidoreductase [Candidatus Binataceae bacterium]
MKADERFDVCLIGAGIIGSSVAMALARRGLKTLAVDIDLSGRLSSSEKNAGGVRATWWQPVNVRLCRASIEYYESIAREVGFLQKGYLWLYDSATWPDALAHLDLQRELGHPIETLTANEVARRVPEIDRLDEVAGATFSPKDGLINPNLLKRHYRAAALRHGAQFLDRVYVLAIEPGAGDVRIGCWRADDAMPDAGLIRLMTQDGPGEAEPGRLLEIHADAVVITGGAWSPSPLRLLGLKNYSEPVRRQICLVDNRTTRLERYGMIVDTSGVYFHNEGQHILAGY